jgi:hypothetical protein
MSETDKDALALLDRNGAVSMALLDDGVLRSISEDAWSLRVEPERFARIPREALRGVRGVVHREVLDVLLLRRAGVVEVEVDNMGRGHGPVGDTRDGEPEHVVRQLVDVHARRRRGEQALQEPVAVIPLAGDEVDQRVAQPAKGPDASLELLEVGLDVPLEHVSDLFCVLPKSPAGLWINIEEDEPERGRG